jgi:aminomuconate-semialdehyde/2-hydroxymuconate-6-semialdehyde dehydrogenase
MTVQTMRKAPASFDSARRDAAHFIDGAFTHGTTGKFWENHCPLDDSVIGRVPEGGKAEIDAACRAARASLTGPWGKMTVAERTDILARVADGVTARLDEFLAAECLDTGKPSSLARHLDIPRGAANFKMFADTVKGVSTETFICRPPTAATR